MASYADVNRRVMLNGVSSSEKVSFESRFEQLKTLLPIVLRQSEEIVRQMKENNLRV